MTGGWRDFDPRAEAGDGNVLWLAEREGGVPRLAARDADGNWAFDGTVGVYQSGFVATLCHEAGPPPSPGPHGAVVAALRRALGEVEVHPVPIGLAVGTGFEQGDGDRVGFYLAGPARDGSWMVVDDGLTVPDLVAGGIVPGDLGTALPPGPLASILASNGARFDADEMEISVGPAAPGDLGPAALRLVATLLQVQGLRHASRTDGP